MKKMVIIVCFMSFMLSACSQVRSDVPDTAPAKATQANVEKFIAANSNYDPSTLVSLYSPDVLWMDNGDAYGPIHFDSLDWLIWNDYGPDQMTLSFRFYLVTYDGRFSVVEGTFSTKNKTTGKWVSMPAVVVLEFEDGKIIKETWYYNSWPMQ